MDEKGNISLGDRLDSNLCAKGDISLQGHCREWQCVDIWLKIFRAWMKVDRP
jgi:hypothetical protein